MLVETDTLTDAMAGDRAALGRVLSACHKDLSLHLSGRIGAPYRSALSIEDVLQVTFVEAFLRIGDLHDRSMEGLLGWLKAAVENNLKDAIRELNAAKRPPRSRQVATTLEESAATFLAGLAGSGTTPTRGARRSEFAVMLEHALGQLPPDYEKAIRLYDLEGRSVDEVAASFDVPKTIGSVHMLRARAKDRLRELLGDTSRFFGDSA